MDEVTGMLATMVPHGMIIKNLAAKWGVKRPTVRRYIERVYDEWFDQAQYDNFQTNRRDQLRHAYQTLYMKALSEGQYATCSGILRELGHLDGTYAPKEIQLGGAVGVGLGLATLGFKTPEEVAERIEELKEMIESGGPTAIGQLGPVIEVDTSSDPGGNGSGNGQGGNGRASGSGNGSGGSAGTTVYTEPDDPGDPESGD